MLRRYGSGSESSSGLGPKGSASTERMGNRLHGCGSPSQSRNVLDAVHCGSSQKPRRVRGLPDHDEPYVLRDRPGWFAPNVADQSDRQSDVEA